MHKQCTSINDDQLKQIMNIGSVHLNTIESAVAQIRNFSPEKSFCDALIYFWESHTKNADDKQKIQATIDLIYKEFDMLSCERYEVRTGYLSRYNYLQQPANECSEEEMKEAVIKGKQEQDHWISRCNPELPGFTIKDWKECVCKDNNRYFDQCKELILEKIEKDSEFEQAFLNSVNEFATRRCTGIYNGQMYLLEELSWMLSLPLLHPNKSIFLIHVGNANDAVNASFQHFPDLRKSVKWLCPRIRNINFKNEAAFLLNYRNNPHLGYAYALEKKNLISGFSRFQKEIYATKEKLVDMLNYANSEKALLSSIIAKLPGHVFWLNRDNVYLGCNEMQAYSLGLRTPSDIVGKTNKMVHTKEDAEILDKNNLIVMEQGISFEGEEYSVQSSKYGNYLSKKTPLFDTHGKVIGLLGIAIDITDRKKAEQLEVESKLQKAVIEEQKAFKSLVEKLSHDVISPLQSLKRLRDTCSHLSAEEYATLNDISSKIENLSGAILNLHKKNYKFDYDLKERDILIPLFLENMIVQKRYEYKDHNIEFKYLYDHKDNFIFIRGRQTDIGCMMSNLINNAVESFCGKDGIVEITLTADDDMVQIGVNDSGIGMPKETADKIIRGEPVHTTKATGHGIGTSQIRNTVVMYNGKMSIDSKEGIGTQITVVFPRSTKPHWIVDKITLRKGSIVVILDDDESSHQIWKDVLKNYDLKLQFFTKGDDAVNFINFSFEKDNIFFIADYNLREEYTGLVRVMEARKQKECIIATGFNTDWEVLDAIEKANVPMLPKQLLRYIPVVVD